MLRVGFRISRRPSRAGITAWRQRIASMKSLYPSLDVSDGFADVSQVARDCGNHNRWLDNYLHHLLHSKMPMLRSLLLLRVLPMPEVLWQLLRVLRSTQGAQAEVSRRTVRSTESGLPLRASHVGWRHTAVPSSRDEGRRPATVCAVRKLRHEEGRARGFPAGDADLGRFRKQESGA